MTHEIDVIGTSSASVLDCMDGYECVRHRKSEASIATLQSSFCHLATMQLFRSLMDLSDMLLQGLGI